MILTSVSPQTRENHAKKVKIKLFDPNSGFFGRTDLRISLSRAKFDVEADFDVRSAVDRPKPRQISEKRKLWSEKSRRKFFFDETFGPKILVFVHLAWFWTSDGQTDLKISFLVKFCFRYTYPEVCASKKPRTRWTSRISKKFSSGSRVPFSWWN